MNDQRFAQALAAATQGRRHPGDGLLGRPPERFTHDGKRYVSFDGGRTLMREFGPPPLQQAG